MNGGGASEMGPDLNRPMNPTEYFQPAALRRYLRDPASVRSWPEQRMPGFAPEQLSEAELEAVIAYLAHMAGGVSKTWGRLVPDHGGGRDVADGAAVGEGEPERGEDDGAGADQPEMGKQPAPGF